MGLWEQTTLPERLENIQRSSSFSTRLALGDEQSLEEETGRHYKMKGPVLGREYVFVVYVAIPQSLIESKQMVYKRIDNIFWRR